MRGLSPQEVESLDSPLAVQVEVHEELGSTQARARELALQRPGAPHGTLVVAGVQTGGKGRLGRVWGSPPGGLWMSLVLRPDISSREAAKITQAAAVGVAKALRGLGVEVRIKWPNDLLVDGRKICGILAEASAGRGSFFVILGVGLNANLDPESLDAPRDEATTLRAELGGDTDPLALVRTLLLHLEAEFTRLHDFGAILDDWRLLDCTLGARVRVRRFGETLEGTALDIGPDGELLLQTSGGVVELFEGEVQRLRRERT